ncbi:hypothetical protein ABW20_dc0103253 [Dactylellina cionopaga]|nr:hypothetical protein ABW20_dc0103253 [Dactylellina cionopaga]
MVSRKRRAAGLKARKTFLAKPKPGFGQRLWIDGDPRSKHKAVWKKLEARVKSNLDKNSVYQEILKRGKELEKSDREFFKHLREKQKAEEKKKQEKLELEQKKEELEKGRGGDSSMADAKTED